MGGLVSTLCVRQGKAILIDDGNVVLEIKSVGPEGVKCVALNTARIKDRRGVNIPQAQIELPALTEKDKRDLRFGIKWDIDFIAASFVRKAQDILDIRAFVAEEMAKHWAPDHPHPKIVAKIESTEGLKNFQEILAVTDAIMVRTDTRLCPPLLWPLPVPPRGVICVPSQTSD
jgi:pyruvate kinase